MTTTATTPFVIERIDLRAETVETWEFENAAEAAARFDSEAAPQNWSLEEMAAELNAEGHIAHDDDDGRFEVIARRVS